MAITSNINKSNFDAQTRALNEQEAQRSQKSSQGFQSSESKKTREHAKSMYNLQAGDSFLEKNPIQEFNKDQVSDLGDGLAVEYALAQEELLKARNMITSGSTVDRINGQTMMTRANNRIKSMGQDLMIMEQDTEESANADNIPGPNSDLINTLYKNNVEGTTKILSNQKGREADPENQNSGRFIQYIDEDGSQKIISVDAYKKILKGTVGRQDVTKWVTTTGTALKADESYRGKTIQGKQEAIQAHIDNYLSDPKVLQALEHQLNVKGAKAVSEELSTMLIGSKDEKIYRKPVVGRQTTPKELGISETFSQRKYDNIQSTNADPAKAEAYMKRKLQGKATRSGPKEWNGVTIDNIKIEDGKITLETTKGDRTLPWNLDQVNALFNEVRYTSESDAKISLANAMSDKIKEKNFGEQYDVKSGLEKDKLVESNLTDVIDSSINSSGTINKDAMEGFVNNMMLEFPKVGLAGLEDEMAKLFGLLGDDQVTFQGKEYKVTRSAEDVKQLKADLNAYIKTRKGQSNQGVGSKYN